MKRTADISGSLIALILFLVAFPVSAASPLKAFGPEVLVGDVVRSCPPELCALAVAPAPLPGQVKTVDRRDVETAVRNAGGDPAGLRIPARVRVTRPAVHVSREEVGKRVETAIKAVLPAGMVLDDIGSMPDMDVPKAGFEVKACRPSDNRYHRRVSIGVEFLSEGTVFRKAQVSALVAMETDVPVSARALRPGEMVQPQDLRWKSVRLTEDATNLALSPEDIVGRLVEMPVEAFSPFEKRALRRVPVVHQGQRLKLETVFGLVRVSAVAVSRQDGAVGDRIRVITIPDNRLVWARVTAPGKGEVVP